jgi:hypothetical protein
MTLPINRQIATIFDEVQNKTAGVYIEATAAGQKRKMDP